MLPWPENTISIQIHCWYWEESFSQCVEKFPIPKKVSLIQTDYPRSRMSNPHQSQPTNPNSQAKIYNWLEDGDGNFSETKVENEDVSEDDEKDWFLEAFLVGYRTEKDRRKRVGAEKEERKKRAVAREKIENEQRRKRKFRK